MTSRLLRVPTDSGRDLVVEIDDREPGYRPAKKPGAIIADAKEQFEKSLADINAAAQSALDILRGGRLRPDEVEIEFGVRLNAEAGAVIAKSSVEGHLVVKLTWTRTGGLVTEVTEATVEPPAVEVAEPVDRAAPAQTRPAT